MKKELFRRSALERLSTPEQLDQIMQVTNPRGWAALTAIGVILATALLWSIFGELPTKVSGRGILIKTGGVFEIQTIAGGRILSMYIHAGDSIRKGQLVAIIAKPEIAVEIKNALETIADLRNEYDHIATTGIEDQRRQKQFLAQQREIQKRSLEVYESDARALNDKLKAQEELIADGLVTKQSLNETRSSYNHTLQQIEKVKNELNEIAVKDFQLVQDQNRQLMNAQFKLNEAHRHLKLLEDNMDLTSKVLSPYTGRVLEAMEDEGDIVQAGSSLCSLELTSSTEERLEAVIFVAPTEGKKIRAGMDVFVAPSTVRKEEFGMLMGRVRTVADFPSTLAGMHRVLGNEQLVQELSAGSSPIALTVDLLENPATFSGYKWSSPKGPDAKMYSGTLCAATVTVRTQSPISLIFPMLRESVGF